MPKHLDFVKNSKYTKTLVFEPGTDAEWGLSSFGQRADGHTREEHVDLLEQRLGVAKCIRGE